MASFGRQQPSFKYGRLGRVVEAVQVPTGPAGASGVDGGEVFNIQAVKNDEGSTVLFTTIIGPPGKSKLVQTDLGNLDGLDGAATPGTDLPVYVAENGRLVLNSDILVTGNIETSTDTNQIIGDIKDTILEDVDGGTF